MGGTEKRRKQPVEPASITKGTALSAESNRKTESDGEQEMGECFLCGARDAALCKACGVVYVCPLHISYHQVDLIPPQSFFLYVSSNWKFFFNPSMQSLFHPMELKMIWLPPEQRWLRPI